MSGLKDENGIFVRPKEISMDDRKELDKIDPLPPPMVSQAELSIDDLLKQGLAAIYEIMRRTRLNIRSGRVDRADVGNLKDCMIMLHELKNAEVADLEGKDDEELAKLAGKK